MPSPHSETRPKETPATLEHANGELITAEISTKAKDFIRRHIRSVWQLELLLLFKGNRGSLSVAEASLSLHMEQRALDECVRTFISAGILKVDGEQRFKYSPSSTALSESIDETAKMYSERRTAVINFIYAAPMRSFSDAFKLKED